MTTDDALRAIARQRVSERRGFWIDFWLYLIVNAVIWAMWLFVLPEEATTVVWPAFVTGGWAIGLVVHGVLTYWMLSGRDDRAVEREIDRLRSAGGARS